MLTYETSYTFPGAGGALPLRELFSAMQEVGAQHEERIGRGAAFFKTLGASWVLVSQQITVTAMPRPGQTVTVSTWLGRGHFTLYARYYRMTDAQGRELLHSASLWSVMELSQRKLLFPEQSGITAPEQSAGPEYPPAGSVPSVKDPPEAERTVQPGDIDDNGHMNNALYLNWVDGMLPGDFYETRELTELTVIYKRELLLNQTAALRVRRAPGETTVQAVYEGKPAFTTRLRWREKAQKESAEIG